jgi:hypothetical protein
MSIKAFVSSICKFAESKPVVDYPPMEFMHLKKAIQYLNSKVTLPHDIAQWDKAKIQKYLDLTRQKKAHIEDWIFEKRRVLREPHYKDLQEAFFRLQQRWDRKVKAVEALLQS